ncbi:hypothetical protein TEQG_04809 [Trichophyton equinum CBS 127.97]|uniref:Uncharacterized protein n=1 Tax=Trichophyton equinum (strain ATCC MYA-4606 / CBS 127.97) TaxID=559882 RepID=F2PV82_TRIEC|nr:hypothetical protein TEQG_04809 [Trichophyton equinum CBS 127.97]
MGAPWRLTRHVKPCAPIAITNWSSRGYFDLKLGGGTELLTKTRSLESKAMVAPFKRRLRRSSYHGPRLGDSIVQYPVVKDTFILASSWPNKHAQRIQDWSWFLVPVPVPGGGSPADQLVFLLSNTGRLDGASFGRAKEEAAILAVHQKITALGISASAFVARRRAALFSHEVDKLTFVTMKQGRQRRWSSRAWQNFFTYFDFDLQRHT